MVLSINFYNVSYNLYLDFFTNSENPSLKIGLIGVGVGTLSISVAYFIEFLRGPERLKIKRISATVDNILKIVEKKES